jgi:hypothetical protein
MKENSGVIGVTGVILILLYKNDPKIDCETLLKDENTAASSEGTLKPVPSAQKGLNPSFCVPYIPSLNL